MNGVYKKKKGVPLLYSQTKIMACFLTGYERLYVCLYVCVYVSGKIVIQIAMSVFTEISNIKFLTTAPNQLYFIKKINNYKRKETMKTIRSRKKNYR